MRSNLPEHSVMPHLRFGEHRLSCPHCDKGPDDTALALKVDERGSTWLCHRCGLKGASPRRRPPVGLNPPSNVVDRTRRASAVGLTKYAARVWRETMPITADSIAGLYLLSRHCALLPPDSDLRWHANVMHGRSGRILPALVGLVTSVEDHRQRLGLHRTYLDPDVPRKAHVDPVRMYLGETKRGCIRLWPDEFVTKALGIGEGIETCLSLALGFRPVWCCMDAGHLAEFPVLGGIESLTIAADNDSAGLSAANRCATRWTDAGLQVRVRVSKLAGADLNDEVRNNG